MRIAIVAPKIPTATSEKDNKLVKIIANNAPSNPVKAALLKISKRENLGLFLIFCGGGKVLDLGTKYDFCGAIEELFKIELFSDSFYFVETEEAELRIAKIF